MSVLLCLVGLHSLQLGGQATVEGMELLEFAAGENQKDVIVILVQSYFYTVYIIVHVVSISLNGHILILVPLLQLR